MSIFYIGINRFDQICLCILKRFTFVYIYIYRERERGETGEKRQLYNYYYVII